LVGDTRPTRLPLDKGEIKIPHKIRVDDHRNASKRNQKQQNLKSINKRLYLADVYLFAEKNDPKYEAKEHFTVGNYSEGLQGNQFNGDETK
jgi:hypothetical protein